MSGGAVDEGEFSSAPVGAIVESCPNSRRYLIVLGDRPVDYTLGTLYHYSLEYWWSDHDVTLNEEYDNTEELEEACSDGGKVAGVELLREGGWKAYELVKDIIFGPRWQKTGVGISVVHYSCRATELVPIYQADFADVDGRWQAMMKEARSYAYAEQSGFVKPEKWPDSIYLVGNNVNNSNTFVRHLVAVGGLTMEEMDMPHPGYMTPQPVTGRYSAAWRSGEQAPEPPPVPVAEPSDD